MTSKRRLRVLLVPSAYYPHVGGIEETTRRLAVELRRRGHQTSVLTNRWPADTPARERLEGVRVRRLRLELPGRRPAALARFAAVAPLSAGALVREVKLRRPDVVHLHGAGPNAAYVAALRRVIGAPVVFTAHGEFRNDAHGSLQRSFALRWGLGTVLRHAACVIAPSRAVLDELREEFDIDAAAATVIPNAVEPADFELPRTARDASRPYIFAAGRLVPQKGFDTLLRAYAGARDSLGGRRLVIAGAGPEAGRLQSLASDLRLDGSVSFTGAVGRPRLAELMTAADAFAFPSRQEAFGIALLEAMAAGTPAVAARVGGVPEFARDGENALLVPPDDADRLAAGLVRLASEPELRERLAAGGRAQAALHSWSRLTPRYEELYASVANG